MKIMEKLHFISIKHNDFIINDLGTSLFTNFYLQN